MRRRSRSLLVPLAAAMIAVTLWPRGSAATVEEQRARLPPPAKCQDPVEGIWMALKHEPSYVPQEWYHFTLEIRRAAPGSPELTGTIVSHFWTGGAKDEKPPPCKGGYEHIIKMPSKGKSDGVEVQFAGTSWERERTVCGQPSGYNIDRLSGRIDPAIQEFQSVNNDGGRAVNDPMVFRRIRCFDPPEPKYVPPIGIRAPAFEPPARTGCSGGKP
jgi:hypothetical protein